MSYQFDPSNDSDSDSDFGQIEKEWQVLLNHSPHIQVCSQEIQSLVRQVFMAGCAAGINAISNSLMKAVMDDHAEPCEAIAPAINRVIAELQADHLTTRIAYGLDMSTSIKSGGSK